MIVSYQFSNSCSAGGSVRFFLRVLAIISLVSFTGMLVYRLAMSSEARANWGRIGVFSSFLIRSLVFSRLCVLGSEAIILIFWVKRQANL